MSSWIIFYITLLSTISFEIFVETDFLLCTKVFKYFKTNFAHFMLRSRSRKFWKSRSRKLESDIFNSDSSTLETTKIDLSYKSFLCL